MSSNGPDDLGDRIAKAKAARADRLAPKHGQEASDSGVSAGGLALRYGAEFGASVAVGIGLGLLIDHFAGTKPWGLLVMMCFGLAAGIMSVARAYRQLQADIPPYVEPEPDGSEDGN